MQDSLECILKWNRRWRICINLTKTEVICFTKEGSHTVDVKVDGRTLAQVESKLCLGVYLDEHITFIKHANNVARKAMGALTKISALMADVGGLKMEIGTALYKSCVRPHLEFAYPVWCCLPEEQLRKLERVQRIALLRATGTVSSTPASALEVLTHIPPLRLRYEEILTQEYIRIIRKPHSNHLRGKLLQLIVDRSFLDHRVLTPIHHISMAVRNLCKDFDPDRIDHEPIYYTGMMLTTTITRVVHTWDNLGNSKNRTAVQAKEARRITEQQLRDTKDNTIVAFTDGSALGNPGPCGASAILYVNGIDSQPVAIRAPVSNNSSSYHGELYAILLAVDFAVNYSANNRISGLRIFSDCQSAILTVCNSSSQNSNFTTLTSDILKRVKQMNDNNIEIDICWVAGHAGLLANELADEEAKLAAQEASEMDETDVSVPLALSEAKGLIHNATLARWQHRWDLGDTGRHFYMHNPVVSTQSIRSYTDRRTECKINRIKTGHNTIQYTIYFIGCKHIHVCSHQCGCGR
jgi:ribonuclease HI